MSQFKIPKLPFFKPGSLVFLGSGHNLIKDGKHYRCAKNSNQICASHRRRINAETIERKFSRLGKTLYTKDMDSDFFVEKLMRENLCDLIFGYQDKAELKDKLANATIAVMHQEVSAGQKAKKSDQKDFNENYLNTIREEYPVMLFGYAVGMIRIFACDISEAEAGRMLAHFSKKIYITDKYEIHSIELERWAWYVFNALIEKNWPGFLASKKKFNFTNGPDKLHGLNIAKASLSFGSEDFPEAIGENFLMPIVMMNQMKEMLRFALKGDMNTVNQSLPDLLNQYQNNQVLRVLLGVSPLSGRKSR